MCIRDRIYSDGSITGSLSLSQTTGSIPLGKTLYIKANTSSSVLWTSSNSSVAVVENGYIRAVGKGTAVITAVSGNAKDVYKRQGLLCQTLQL